MKDMPDHHTSGEVQHGTAQDRLERETEALGKIYGSDAAQDVCDRLLPARKGRPANAYEDAYEMLRDAVFHALAGYLCEDVDLAMSGYRMFDSAMESLSTTADEALRSYTEGEA